MENPMIPKIKKVLIVVAVIAALAMFDLIKDALKKAEVTIINKTGSSLKISIDGSEVSPAGGTGNISCSVANGTHELVIRQQGKIIFQEKQEFKKTKNYYMYCGTNWLKVEKIQYGGFNLPIVLPTQKQLEIDGKTKHIAIQTKKEFENFAKLFGDVQAVYTRPALFSFDSYESDIILPDQSIPKKSKAHKDIGTYRLALRVIPSDEQWRYQRWLNKAN